MVYKILLLDNNRKRGKYMSPFYSQRWYRGKVQKTPEMPEPDVSVMLRNSNGETYIGPGMFHSYKKLEDALTSAEEFKYYRNLDAYVGVFKIPAGSEAYEGVVSGEPRDGYASKELKFIGIY